MQITVHKAGDESKTTTMEAPMEYFAGLGPLNTVSDFITEFYTTLYMDILGQETMDRALGSFNPEEFFRLMAKIFLMDGNQKLYKTALKEE